MTFSRPDNDWKTPDGRKRWVACCSLGGSVSGVTKNDVQRQIEYWTARPTEWTKWLFSLHEKPI